MDNEELRIRFEYHKPTEIKIEDHQFIRTWCFTLAQNLNVMLPEGRDKSLAFTKLEEVMFHANAAIARN